MASVSAQRVWLRTVSGGGVQQFQVASLLRRGLGQLRVPPVDTATANNVSTQRREVGQHRLETLNSEAGVGRSHAIL